MNLLFTHENKCTKRDKLYQSGNGVHRWGDSGAEWYKLVHSCDQWGDTMTNGTNR